MTQLFARAATLCAAAMLWTGAAQAGVTVYQGDLAGFLAASGGGPPQIDFESLAGDITGLSVSSGPSSVTFSSPDGNALMVVPGAATVTDPGDFSGVIDASTNKLLPTSGTMVLSPGGEPLVPGPAPGQRDSLQIDITPGATMFGIDILFQSLDCCSFTSFQLFDDSLVPLLSGTVNTTGAAGGPGGAFFLGFITTIPNQRIGRVVFTESDDDGAFPDANIGFDSLRNATIITDFFGVPEPSTWALLIAGFGLAGASLRKVRARPVAA